MGFLKKFFRNVFHDEAPPATTSSFERLSEEELEAHLGVRRYGDFELTDAVRPSYDLQVIPQQGFRHDTYHDEQTRASVPVLMRTMVDAVRYGMGAAADNLQQLLPSRLNPARVVEFARQVEVVEHR